MPYDLLRYRLVMGRKIPCRDAAPYSLRLGLYTGAFGAKVDREWNCD